MNTLKHTYFLVLLALIFVQNVFGQCVGDVTSPTAICRTDTIELVLTTNGFVVVSPTLLDNGSFDNCGIEQILINGSNLDTFSCADLGLQIVTLTVIDSANNQSSCTSTILIKDITSPLASCKTPVDVYLNASGFATITPNQLDNGSFDNCGIAMMQINNQTLWTVNCANVGVNTALLTVIDMAGNSSSCAAVINVLDTIAPVAVCQAGPITLPLSSNGTSFLSATMLEGASTDNCGIASYMIEGNSFKVFDCADIGVNTTYLTVTDISGNTDICSTDIIVLDNTAPVVNCKNITIQIGGNNTATLFPIDINNGSTDNCGILSYSFSGGQDSIVFDTSDAGTHSINLIVTDINGNVDSCAGIGPNITIIDTTNTIPTNCAVFIANNINVSCFGGNDGQITAMGNGTFPISYQWDASTTSQTTPTATGLPVGFYSVTMTDALGCTASTNSVITGPNTLVIASAAVTSDYNGTNISCNGAADGEATAVGTGGVLGYTYQWGANTGYQTTPTAIGLSAGAYTVTVFDANGCSDQTTIMVTEPTPIQVSISTIASSCANNDGIMVANPSGGNTFGSYSYQWQQGQTSQTIANLNAGYWNQVIVFDINGCTAVDYATVPSIDTVAPTIICVDTTLYLNQGGNAYLSSFDIAQQYGSDECGITWSSLTTMGGPTAVYNCNQIGNFAETIVVYDDNNNFDSCTFNVTILDTVAPIANCAIYTAYVNGANTALVYPTDINDSSTDNCSVVSMLINGSSVVAYTSSNTGYNPVTLTVYDGSGNSSTCNTWVYVVDSSQTPVANCVGNYTAYLNNSGNALIQNNDINNGSTGNNIFYYIDGPLGIGTSMLPVNCSNLGSYNYNFIVVDNMSQRDTCSFVLTVADTIAPVANCKTVHTLALSGTSATLLPSDLDNGSVDNCGIASMLVNGQSSLTFNCNDVGTAQWVTLTVIDAFGNTSSCQTLVYIMGGTCGVQASLVSSSPSACDTSLCTGAATITAAGGQNPYTFLWNDGNTNASRTGLCPAIYTVVVTDANSDKDTLSVTVGYAQGCVWAGDTDDDAQVNNMDLLPIALAYGAPGLARPNASLVWEGQYAPDWNIANPVPNLPDYKHIDCDGSALIDLTDVNAITQNYGLSYVRSNHSKSGNIPFYVETDTAYEQDRIGLSIYLGETDNLATDVYAVAFTINYDPMVVEAGSTSIDYSNSWLGANLISVQKDFYSQGKIETAVGRINHINTSGFGQIGTFYITIRDDVLRAPIAQDMPITITNVRLIDKDNNIIGTDNQTGILTVLKIITSTSDIKEQKRDLKVFPNPSNGELVIQSKNALLKQLRVLTVTGQTVLEQSLNGQSTEQINLNNLPNGSYILSITTDEEVINKQVIIRH